MSMSISPGGTLPLEAIDFMDNRQKLAGLHVDRGAILAQQGHLDAAMDEYRKALQANPWNATAYQNIGTALWRLGDLAKALLWYEKALEIDPRRVIPAEMMTLIRRVRSLEAHARTEMEAGRRETALADLTAAADLCGESQYQQELADAIQALSADE